jgi:hypothetical protein
LTFFAVNESFNNLRLGILVQAAYLFPAALIMWTIPEIQR